jgi:hypothetical protein
MKALRRLDGMKLFSQRGFDYPAAARHTMDSLRRRECRYGASFQPSGFDHTLHGREIAERPDCVVHQDQISIPTNPQHRAVHRFLPFAPAAHEDDGDLSLLHPEDGSSVPEAPCGSSEHNLHKVVQLQDALDGAQQNRLAVQLEELLGQ